MESLAVQVIYEDADVLAINKPAGMRVHGDAHGSGETVVDWLLARCPAVAGVGDSPESGRERPGVVHRLDKDTSGVLVLAKTQTAYDFLKKSFQEHIVDKTYVALVYGEVKPERGVIDWPIGRSRTDPRRRVAGRGASGKLREALTEYQVLEIFPSYSYLEIYPKTGRTHQIRVHCKALGYPIACDALYAPGKVCPAPLTRQALHATKLTLTLPSSGRVTLEADLPADMSAALTSLRST